MIRIEPFAFTRGIFFALALLSPLLLTPYNYELFEFNKMLFVYFTTVLIGGSILIEFIRLRKVLTPNTPFDIPIFLFLLSQLISTIISIDPHVSLFGYYGRFNGGLLSILCYIILYYCFTISFHESVLKVAENINYTFKNIQNILKFWKKDMYNLNSYKATPREKSLIIIGFITMISASLVSMYGIAQRYGIDAHLWVQDVQNRVFSTQGQPNWLAAYLVVMTILAISFILTIKTNKSLLMTILPLVFYTTILFTKSRSGFIAFWICYVIFALIVVIKSNIISREKRLWFIPLSANKEENYRLVIFLLLGILFVLFTIVFNSPLSISSINTKSDINTPPVSGTALEDVSFNTKVTDSGDIRKIVWTGAWNAALARPYFGWGLETFAWAYYRFRPVEHNLTSEWDFLYNKAHNEYLNYATTAGFFGLGTYLLLIGAFLWWWLRKIVKDKFSTKYITVLGLGTAWISLLITNFFGFSVVVTSLLFWLLPSVSFLLGSSTYIASYTLKMSSLISKIITAGVVITCSYLLFSISMYWIADYHYARAISAAGQDKYKQSYDLLSTAITLKPGEPVYLNEISETLSILAFAYQDQNDATMSAELTKQAIQASTKALGISPLNVSFWKGRTRVFYNLSQIDPQYLDYALKSIETAQTLAPTDPKVAYNRAILLNNVGRNPEAIEVLEQAIKMKPNYRDAAFALSLFYEEEKNMEKRDEWLQYILTNINPEDSEVKEKLEIK